MWKEVTLVFLNRKENNFPENTILKYGYAFGEEYSKYYVSKCAIRTPHEYVDMFLLELGGIILDYDWYWYKNKPVQKLPDYMLPVINYKKIVATTCEAIWNNLDTNTLRLDYSDVELYLENTDISIKMLFKDIETETGFVSIPDDQKSNGSCTLSFNVLRHDILIKEARDLCILAYNTAKLGMSDLTAEQWVDKHLK